MFYTLLFLTYFDPTDMFFYVVVASLFAPLLVLISLVAVLVTVVLFQNPHLLLKQTTIDGGSMSLGIVLTGNTLVHYTTVIIASLFILLEFQRLRVAYFIMVNNTNFPAKCTYVFIQMFSILLLIGFYSGLVDFQRVYGLPPNDWLFFLMGVITFIVVAILFFSWFVYRLDEYVLQHKHKK